MWKWFLRRRAVEQVGPEVLELKGAPAHARTKTYSAETGFVYQYVYRGYRRMSDDGGMEHVFEASRDRQEHFPVTVHLLDAEVARCTQVVGRDLIGAERYALVKMSLFEALDEFADLSAFEKPLMPEAVKMEEFLRTLGRI
jgi:hypothetical protein